MQKNIQYQKAFTALGNAEMVEEKKETFAILEKFVCQIYGMKCEKVNDARYEKFLATYKTSDA